MSKRLFTRIATLFKPAVHQRHPDIKFVVTTTVWSLASFIRGRVTLLASIITTASLYTRFIERLRIFTRFLHIPDDVIGRVKKRTEQIRSLFGDDTD